MQITAKARGALHGRFNGTHTRGYVRSPQENLLPGIDWTRIEEDLRRGNGDELSVKFMAIHSSAALAVNCFGRFKHHPDSLQLLGKQGARSVKFERKLPIFGEVGAPNIDVWIDRGQDAVGVESKLLEYLSPKKPKFSARYEKLAPPKSDPLWWHLYELAKEGNPQHLDEAQLIKHYFGLNEFQKRNPDGPALTLLYIFWEPLNWQEVDECRKHREEVESFAGLVSKSQIQFRWMSYNDLWRDWRAIPELEEHAQQLMGRYQLRLQC